MYAISGATGQLGRLVIDALLKTIPANQVIAAVRDPAKARDLAERGVIVREADYNRPDQLSTALAGVDKLLLISSSEVTGRLAQHRAVVEGAQRAGVSLIAYTSMLHADTSPARLAVEHRQTEEVIAASGLPAVILRNGWYTENHLLALPAALEHGAFVGAAKNGRFSSAARQDYAEAAAVVLTTGDHAGRTYELAADQAFKLTELAAEVSRQSGKTIAYNDLSQRAYEGVLTSAGLPADLAAILADADVAASRGAMFDDGGALRRLIGRPTTPMENLVGAALASTVHQPAIQAKEPSPVIEVVTLKLKSGVTAAQFKSVDREIAAKYISVRSGFLSRESAPGSDNTWLAIIHWRSAADADASMKSFSAAPPAEFLSMIEPDSVAMTRYGW